MRNVVERIRPTEASDGAGVKLLRVFGGQNLARFDPFLMLDEFGSFNPDDYIAGFPPHPHRGFETITYMLEGKMEHQDHMGNVGLLKNGDVQWMTAARGIIHSEMPKQTEGRMRGFQFWLNLPAKDKMSPADYEDVVSERIPVFAMGAVWVKAIAGNGSLNGEAVEGLMQKASTEPLLWDMHVNAGAKASVDAPSQSLAMIYVYEGKVEVAGVPVGPQELVRLDGEGNIEIQALEDDVKLMLIAGKPLKEPIVHYGPFVMNTTEEIEQALQDYRSGTLTA